MASSRSQARTAHCLLTLLFMFALSLFLPHAAAQTPPFTRSYDTEAVALSSLTHLYYTVDLENDVIHLGVHINDTASLSSSTQPVWAGFGIGESTSGSMLGADMVTIQFPGGSNYSSCELQDRYVPWTSYPLLEPPMPFPLHDDCPDPDWALISCTHTQIEGTITFEVRRTLSISSDQEYQDRPIVPGSNAVLAAHGGGELSYHGGRNRVSARVTFFDDNDDTPDEADDEDTQPDDVDGYFDIRATDYEIPSDHSTTYACTTVKAPIEEGRMIVAVEPLIDDDVMKRGMVHHFVVYLCEGEEYYNITRNTVKCGGDDFSNDGDEVCGRLADVFELYLQFIQ